MEVACQLYAVTLQSRKIQIVWRKIPSNAAPLIKNLPSSLEAPLDSRLYGAFEQRASRVQNRYVKHGHTMLIIISYKTRMKYGRIFHSQWLFLDPTSICFGSTEIKMPAWIFSITLAKTCHQLFTGNR